MLRGSCPVDPRCTPRMGGRFAQGNDELIHIGDVVTSSVSKATGIALFCIPLRGKPFVRVHYQSGLSSDGPASLKVLRSHVTASGSGMAVLEERDLPLPDNAGTLILCGRQRTLFPFCLVERHLPVMHHHLIGAAPQRGCVVGLSEGQGEATLIRVRFESDQAAGCHALPALIPQIRDATPSQNTRVEVLDTRSSESCRGRVVVNACLGWSYG